MSDQPLLIPPTHTLGAEIDQDGKMRFINGSVAGILEGIEGARIRRCPICEVIYWAGRLDKPACSGRCCNVVRQRRHRRGYSDRYLDRYKEQRYRKAELMGKANTEPTRSPSRGNLASWN